MKASVETMEVSVAPRSSAEGSCGREAVRVVGDGDAVGVGCGPWPVGVGDGVVIPVVPFPICCRRLLTQHWRAN
jgi:hypothetical protein